MDGIKKQSFSLPDCLSVIELCHLQIQENKQLHLLLANISPGLVSAQASMFPLRIFGFYWLNLLFGCSFEEYFYQLYLYKEKKASKVSNQEELIIRWAVYTWISLEARQVSFLRNMIAFVINCSTISISGKTKTKTTNNKH